MQRSDTCEMQNYVGGIRHGVGPQGICARIWPKGLWSRVLMYKQRPDEGCGDIGNFIHYW